MRKIAIVTGASRGVGLEIARRFVARGWVVAGLARSETALASVRAELGDAFEGYAADIGQPAQVRRAFAHLGERHPTVDLLVNNAAVFKMARFEACDDEDISRMIDTNLKGTLFCTHAALKLLRRPGGRIVNVGSVAGTHGIKEQAIYCASKFGVDGFAEALGQETIEDGIAITTLCPGGIDTPLWAASAGNPYPGDISKILQPGDVAQMIEAIADLPPRVVLKKAILFPANEWH